MDVNRTLVADGLYQYQFPPNEGEMYGFNLYALLSKKQALLIDTAYEQQAAEVLADLVANDYTIEHILISHFHPDHVSGLKALPTATVWGSDQYALSLDDYYSSQAQQSLPPVQGLSNSFVLEFHPFTLTFRLAPGHSPCSMYTIIDNRYIHVADNLMATNDGTPLLPWAPLDQVENHIQSLQLLKELQPQMVLLAHGQSIEGGLAIHAAIDDRIKYLQVVWETNGEATFEEATAHCSRPFVGKGWHISSSEQ